MKAPATGARPCNPSCPSCCSPSSPRSPRTDQHPGPEQQPAPRPGRRLADRARRLRGGGGADPAARARPGRVAATPSAAPAGARLARRRLAQLPGLEPVPQRGRHRRRGAAAAPRRARRRGVATGQSQGLDDGPRRAGTVRREGAGQAGRIGLLALLFFLVSLPCLASWALLGVGSARLLRSPSLMKRFNQGMALLLLASAWAALLL